MSDLNEPLPESDSTSNNDELELDQIFQPTVMGQIWRTDRFGSKIRDAMRKQNIQDLHDYLDFHRNLEGNINRIIGEIKRGQYRPKKPVEVRLEKKLGITRKLLQIAPSDALVFQTLTTALESQLLSNKPNDQSFYTRSHSAPKKPDEIDGSWPYPWFLLWREYQENIFQFNSSYDFVVTTDIASYFDCISLVLLRNTLASFGQFSDKVLDFLFYILEAYLWRPDYIPSSDTGLPQIDFDAPRLLAHTFLYKIDSFLSDEVGSDFVRWMDDINFGCDSRDTAKNILGELEVQLNTLNLRLNVGKSNILNNQEARSYFWFEENRYLTVIENLYKLNPSRRQVYEQRLKARYLRFKKRIQTGQAVKIVKRYFTLFKKLDSTYLERFVPKYLSESSPVRENIFRYYADLGYTPKRYQHIVTYMLSQNCLDDVSVFKATQVLINWSIPLRSSNIQKSINLQSDLFDKSVPKESRFISSLWLLSKYGSEIDLANFVLETQVVNFWQRSDWLARQVAATIPLLPEESIQQIVGIINRRGLRDAQDVISNLNDLHSSDLNQLDLSLRGTLVPPSQRVYPLSKIILTKHMLQSQHLDTTEKTYLYEGVNQLTSDPIYILKLERVMNNN